MQTWLRQHKAPTTSSGFATSSADVRWVFLGPPGVGKGTYASRVASAFDAQHIAVGDLIRNEIKQGSALGLQMKAFVGQGKLLPDDVVFKLVAQRLQEAEAEAQGYILDGFPRTHSQATQLLSLCDINLALNLSVREEVLVQKCMGRRICTSCGKNYNIANIYLPASNGRPEVVMPPLDPPAQCMLLMECRSDDTESVILRRIQIYKAEAEPVENVFRHAGVLVDFEITGGIPETLPVLLSTLESVSSKGQPELCASGP